LTMKSIPNPLAIVWFFFSEFLDLQLELIKKSSWLAKFSIFFLLYFKT
jgi:hypothetical protein